MAIIAISRFKGAGAYGALARQSAVLLKKHGALSVQVGRCQSGSYAGEIVVATTFADWEAFGRGMQAITADPAWRKLYGEFTRAFTLTDRSIVVAEEY